MSVLFAIEKGPGWSLRSDLREIRGGFFVDCALARLVLADVQDLDAASLEGVAGIRVGDAVVDQAQVRAELDPGVVVSGALARRDVQVDRVDQDMTSLGYGDLFGHLFSDVFGDLPHRFLQW